MNHGRVMHSQRQHAQMDAASVAIIIAAAGGLASVFVTGLWTFLGGRKKSSMDAQASLVSGFVSLLASVQGERDRLLGRIEELEANNQKQDRRIAKMERTLLKNNIAIPEDEA